MVRKTVTSTAVKSKWNKRHYDRLDIMLPKGMQEPVNKRAEELGLSRNAYLNELIRNALGVSEEDWHPLYVLPNE